MRRISFFLFIIFFGLVHKSHGQFQSFDEMAYLGGSTPTGKNHDESLIFEARPILKLPITGNLYDALLSKNRKKYIHITSLIFDPQIRMHNENSVPVKMPTYRVFGSYNIVRQLGDLNCPWALASINVEHGHYSNGQSGCVFGNSSDNDSICNSMVSKADIIIPKEALNRENGEFSTDFLRSKLKFMYFCEPMSNSTGGKMVDAIEITFGYTRLVDRLLGFDIGGYANYASKFYPLNQWYSEIAYEKYTDLHGGGNQHWRVGAEYFYRPSKNRNVYAHNFGITGAYFLDNNLGFFIKLEYGQDSYNIYFVDKISRILVGASWQIHDLPRLSWSFN